MTSAIVVNSRHTWRGTLPTTTLPVNNIPTSALSDRFLGGHLQQGYSSLLFFQFTPGGGLFAFCCDRHSLGVGGDEGDDTGQLKLAGEV